MDNIVVYMNDYHLDTDCQHGFCKHRSCENRLLHVVEDLNNNGYFLVLFIQRAHSPFI